MSLGSDPLRWNGWPTLRWWKVHGGVIKWRPQERWNKRNHWKERFSRLSRLWRSYKEWFHSYFLSTGSGNKHHWKQKSILIGGISQSSRHFNVPFVAVVSEKKRLGTNFHHPPPAEAYSFRRAAEDPERVPLTQLPVRALMAPPGVPDFFSRTRVVAPGKHQIIGKAGGWSVDGLDFGGVYGNEWVIFGEWDIVVGKAYCTRKQKVNWLTIVDQE